MRRYLLATVTLVVVAIALAWIWFATVPRRATPPPTAEPPAPEAAAPAEAEARRIKATLYYVSGDGLRLVAVEREVPYGESTTQQARYIADEQVRPAPASYGSPFPPGTTVRALFVTDRGDAFVDLSNEASANHEGGSLAELLTVYALVNALTTNLPAVTGVQILVGGQEVDTLAGHIDLRHPLRKNLGLVANPGAAAPKSDDRDEVRF